MKESKICMICEDELGKFSCVTCGKVVGLKCFDSKTNQCVNCKQGKKVELGKIY